MPLSRRSLADRVRKVTIPIPELDAELCVWYKPDALSVVTQRELLDRATTAAAGTARLADELAIEYLLLVLAKWDLFEDEKFTKPTPITRKSIEALGWESINRISEAIQADKRPNPPTGASSVNGSAPGASGDTPPIGSFA